MIVLLAVTIIPSCSYRADSGEKVQNAEVKMKPLTIYKGGIIGQQLRLPDVDQITWLYEQLGRNTTAPGPIDYKFYAVLPYKDRLPQRSYSFSDTQPEINTLFMRAGIDIKTFFESGEQVNVDELLSASLIPLFAAQWKGQVLIIMMSM
ncbi:hypothetical protein [Deinococcus arcticus]|uniref:hypothetical protein n=1 Tax=Deinococcus arcticus TaxID=2136176 RepID=UPI0011B26F17|nr:hypothetical protein [Deinococcus arcticus]